MHNRLGRIGQSFLIFLELSRKLKLTARNKNVENFFKNNDALRSDSAFLWQPKPIIFPKMILNQKSLVLVKMIAFISALREKFVQFFT